MTKYLGVSVVVTAYNRREYIKRAVDSILRQTLNRNYFEIIVVKNYEDKDVDNYLSRIGVIMVKSKDNDTFGSCLANGIIRSQGDIICFLDDDDEFVESKLEKVYHNFADNNLSFFHNAMIPVDSEGNEIKNHWIWKMATEKDVLIENPSKYGEFKTLFRYGPDFGASSICISRALALKLVHHLDGMTSASDNLMFYYACTGNFSIKISSERLTRYRIHSFNSSRPASNSFQDYLKRYRKNAFEAFDSYRMICSIVEGYPISEFANYRLSSYKFAYYSTVSRENGFPSFLELLKFLKCDYYLRIPRVVVYGLLYFPLRFSTKVRQMFVFLIWKIKYLT